MEEQVLETVISMLEIGIEQAKSRKDKRIMKEIKDYIESKIEYIEGQK